MRAAIVSSDDAMRYEARIGGRCGRRSVGAKAGCRVCGMEIVRHCDASCFCYGALSGVSIPLAELPRAECQAWHANLEVGKERRYWAGATDLVVVFEEADKEGNCRESRSCMLWNHQANKRTSIEY